MKNRDAGDIVNIGKIGSSVGLRGEVRVTLYAQDSDNLKEGKVLLLKRGQNPGSGALRKSAASSGSVPGSAAVGRAAVTEYSGKCRSVRLQNGRTVIRIEGIDDRNKADGIRGMEVYIYAEDLEELPEGEHYVRDILGYTVRDIASGTSIGRLHDVIQNTSQSILDVHTEDGRSVLIPAVDAFLREINDDEELITVELIPGFLD